MFLQICDASEHSATEPEYIIRPKTRLSMAAEGAVNAYKGAEGAIIRAFNHEGMKIVESSCNR